MPCSWRNSARPSTRLQLGDVGRAGPSGPRRRRRRRRARCPPGRRRGSPGSRSGGRRRSARPSPPARRRRPRRRSPRPAPARRPRPAARRPRRGRRGRTSARRRDRGPGGSSAGGRRPRRWRRRTARGRSRPRSLCTTMARATSPKPSKKFLVARPPGRARASTPMQLPLPRPGQDGVHDRGADTHAPGLGLHVEVAHDGQAAVVGQGLDGGHGVADDGVVDRADQDQRVVVGPGRSARPSSRGSRRAAWRRQTMPPFSPASSSMT